MPLLHSSEEASMPFALTITGLSKTYPNGVQALDGVSLTIPTGMFGLLGPNGAGKSTLMRTLATLQDADAGTARMGDIDVLRDKAAVRRTLGYLPQDFGVYPKVSAEELLDHLARLKGLADRRERNETVATLLQQTNLYDVRRKALGGFSGGMRQRFGIAQALLGNPRLIIVDEPTAGLDPEERVRFHNLLAEIGENVIVILSTHIVSDVSDLCGRMAIINKGRVLLTGSPLDLTRTLDGRVWQKAIARTDLDATRGSLSGDLDAPSRRQHARQRRQRCVAGRRLQRRRAHARGRLLCRDRRPPAGACAGAGTGMSAPLAAIAAFEFRTRVKRISTWVYFAIFFALAMLWTAAAGGAIPNAIVSFGSGKVWVNSPYAIAQTVAFLGMAALTIVAAVMGRSVQQDFEYRVEPFFFTAPIRRRDYLGGRFLGAAAVLTVILSSIPLGGVAGLMLPGIDADRVGPMRLSAYAMPYVTMLVPNIIVLGGLFFCIAAMTRRMLPVYIASVLLLIGYLAARGLLRDLDNKTLAAMLDPFGVTANSNLTEYWSISERNTRLVPLEGVLLWNRLLWLSVTGAVIALCSYRFAFTQPVTRRKAARDTDAAAVAATAPSLRPLASAAARASAAAPVVAWRLLPRMVWLNFRETVKNVYFGVIALAGVLFCISTSTTAGSIFGTVTWPVTYQMLELVSGTFAIFLLVIITFYAGELTWRERETRLDQIHDALPIPTWLPFVAKLLALMLVPVVLQAVLMLCGLGIQTAKGYHHYELGLYFKWLFGFQLIDYWLICVLALVVHSLVNQKYLGHLVMIVYFIALSFSDLLGFEHNLYKYGSNGNFTYSDMNGFGHFVKRIVVFDAYWAAAALLLAVAGYLFWVRGTTADWRGRVRVARRAVQPADWRRHRSRRDRDGRIRRLHLLQHERAECVRDDVRPPGTAGRIREEIQGARVGSTAGDHRRHRRRRSLSVGAARTDEGPLCAAESHRTADRHDPPALFPAGPPADQHARIQRAGRDCHRRHGGGAAQLPACDAACAGRQALARLRSRGSDGRLHERGLDDRRRLQRLVRQRTIGVADRRL